MGATMKWATADEARADVCGDKIPYSPSSARNVAATINADRPSERPMQAYRCPFCGRWHTGHILSIEGMQALANILRGFDSDGNQLPEENPDEA